jgi:HlyD family secretion protein
VDAYTTKIFKGTVVQTRQAPITVQNVVTYDVVVGVSNAELLLMPGMTANITIESDRRDDVLRVPLRALAFSPHQHAGPSPGHERSEHLAHVWVEDGGGIHRVNIARGLDDGNLVEVLSGDLKAGDVVVTDRANLEAGARAGGLGGPGLHLHM